MPAKAGCRSRSCTEVGTRRDCAPAMETRPSREPSNPLRSDGVSERRPEPATIVIFGASGDLTQRKLVPALYSLAAERLIPRTAIVGFSRSDVSDESFRSSMREGVAAHARKKPIDSELWSTFGSGLFYQRGQFDDPASFYMLRRRLEQIESELGLPGNRLFYLAVPPSAFAPIVQNLGAAGLVDSKESPFARVIIEKPFGTDLESARSLNKSIRAVLKEKQIYRIDHYLGKETVQNLLVFRFANGIFEPLWNNRYVDHVQITGAETLGVEGRGGYFDHSGNLRDMVQNHLLQVLALAALEPPVHLDGEFVRDEKVKVLRALRPIGKEDIERRVIRGQYAAGSLLGADVPGYLEEKGVAPESKTETFVALKLAIDNWRWAGVPFYLRSAKRMPKRVTEISIHFKSAPHRLFRELNLADAYGNVLAIRIQPDEGIRLNIGTKVPGPSSQVAPVTMEFRYASTFGTSPPEAYERLLLDSLVGDSTLFIREDEVDASWSFITPIHKAWAESNDRPHAYAAGEWGPAAAHALLEKDGRAWRRP
jgi:glucose-6-phosphate 1-dehydrogenase